MSRGAACHRGGRSASAEESANPSPPWRLRRVRAVRSEPTTPRSAPACAAAAGTDDCTRPRRRADGPLRAAERECAGRNRQHQRSWRGRRQDNRRAGVQGRDRGGDRSRRSHRGFDLRLQPGGRPGAACRRSRLNTAAAIRRGASGADCGQAEDIVVPAGRATADSALDSRVATSRPADRPPACMATGQHRQGTRHLGDGRVEFLERAFGWGPSGVASAARRRVGAALAQLACRGRVWLSPRAPQPRRGCRES